MNKIIVNSAALADIAHEIEQGCFMLGFVSDADDIDDVEYYTQRIRRAGDSLRNVINKSEKVKE